MRGTIKRTFQCLQMIFKHLKMLSRMTPNMSLTFCALFNLKETNGGKTIVSLSIPPHSPVEQGRRGVEGPNQGHEEQKYTRGLMS